MLNTSQSFYEDFKKKRPKAGAVQGGLGSWEIRTFGVLYPKQNTVYLSVLHVYLVYTKREAVYYIKLTFYILYVFCKPQINYNLV